MIDIHNHILPYDDGPKTIDESISLAKIAVKEGIKKIVYTPHFHTSDYKDYTIAVNEFNRRITLFKGHLEKDKIPLEIIYGMEIHISPDIIPMIKSDPSLFTINNNSKYLLLELPFYSMPIFTEQIVYDLLSMGITPIIAHIERCSELCESVDKVIRLREMGCLTQLNSRSLLGRYGSDVEKAAKIFIKKNLVSVMASDVHQLSKNDNFLINGLKYAENKLGKDIASKLVNEIPKKIIDGDKI